MGDSDDEYDRKRRDKFRGERNEYRDRRESDRRREDWVDSRRDNWNRTRSRTDYHDYRRERYSPARRHDISPQVKRMRGDWEDRRYSYDSGYSSYSTWSHDAYNTQGVYGTSVGGQRGESELGPTQPPMMSFKSFLATQDDSITDEDAIKKYAEYKLEFKRQQLNEFFVSHKEEEWFKIKYHPEESVKRREEQLSALKKRVEVFMHFMVDGLFMNITIDADYSDSLVKVLDSVVIMLEGGAELDLKVLDQPIRQEEKPVEEEAKPFILGAEDEKKKEREKAPPPPEPKKDPSAPMKLTISSEQVELQKKAKEFLKQKGVEPDESKKKKRKRESREYEYESRSGSGTASSTDSDDDDDDDDEPEPPGTGLSWDGLQEYMTNLEKKSKRSKLKKRKIEGAEDDEPLPPGLERKDSEEEEEGEKPKENGEKDRDEMEEEVEPKEKPEEEEEESDRKYEDMDTDEKKREDEEDTPKKEQHKDKDEGEESEDQERKKEKAKDDEKDEDSEDKEPKPRPLHKTASIFLRNLAPTITKQEVEAMCKRYPGFLRAAIADPQPERRWFRRGWVTFERSVNIKEICWNLNNIRLRDCELGAIVNRDLSRRIRTVNGITSHKQVVRHDIKLAAKIIQNLDARWDIWGEGERSEEDPDSFTYGFTSKNPVLKNITDYLIEEASAEEEELLGGLTDMDEGKEEDGGTVDRDDELIKVLDKLLFYLRIVHSVDYYNHSEYPNEDEMPNRCGIMHARGIPPSSKVTQQEISDYCRTFEQKIASFLTPITKLNEDEAGKLGMKDADSEVEKFVQANTQELAKDKWLCPLSGKKFKGPEFVRKHVFNKHGEKIEEVKNEVQYFNNYLRDPKRPQLPEHPGNKQQRGKEAPGERTDVYAAAAGYTQYGNYGYGSSGGVTGYNRGYTAGYGRDTYNRDPYRDAYSRSRPNYQRNRSKKSESREIIGYHDLDSSADIDVF